MEPARKFKIIVDSKECGTCSGSSPSVVAKKVVKKLCGKSNKMVKFSLKECKRGCERMCGPYQGRMEKLDRPYKRSGKTITHRVVCGKVRKMRGGVNGIELSIKDLELPIKMNNYFIIKPINLIPCLFLYSNEYVKKEYQTHFKFVICNDCKVIKYEDGHLIEITYNNNNNSNNQKLLDSGLFELLNKESVFTDEKNGWSSSKKIIDIIKIHYPKYTDIIACLERLHSIYQKNKRNKRNSNYKSYMQERTHD